MEENLSYKKKCKAFISAAVIVNTVIFTALNFIVKDSATESPTFYSELMLRIPAIAATLIALVLLFLIGKKLTGDNRKTVVFMGAVYFGHSIVDAVTLFVHYTLESLSETGYIAQNIITISEIAIPVIEIPFAIAIACFAFSTFEGYNRKSYGITLEDSKLGLSRARTRYFAYEIIGGLVAGIITAIPTLLVSLLTLQEFNDVALLTTITAKFSLAIGTVVGLFINYLAGYRPYRSRVDAMGFVACSALSAKIVTIPANLIAIPEILALNKMTANVAEAEVNLSSFLPITGASSFLSVLLAAVTLGTALFMLRYFFSKETIPTFGYNEPVQEQTDITE